MRTYIVLFGVICLVFHACKADTGDGPIKLIVQTDVTWSNEQKKAIEDIQFLWRQLRVENGSEKLVLFLKLTPPKNNQLNKEAITITSLKNDTLQIEAVNRDALIHGIYSWLEHIGLRFYGPGAEWTYIPETIKESKLFWDANIKPDFSLRYFFSGMGFGQKIYPELNEIKDKWTTWHRRLRLGNPNQMDFSHYGTAFNKKYRKQIERHPEWRALVGGKRQPWSARLKLCYSSAGVQELYVQDAISRLKKKKKEGQKPPYYINMEPADGVNYCECIQCKQFSKRLGDPLFKLVNTVAKELYQVDKNARVFLLGYTFHALPPSFELENNVFVVIAPDYGVYPATSPDKVLKLWLSEHPGNLFLRGYLGIPQWNHDLPLGREQQSKYLNRIDFITKNNFLGFNYQTSYSYGSTGWLQYLIAHKSWNPNFDTEEAWNEFIQNMFPDYEDEMKQFYKYLALSGKSRLYLPSAMSILDEIIVQEKTGSMLMIRLQSLREYLNYIGDYYDLQLDEDNESSKGIILDQVGKMYKTNMTYTFALYQLIKKDERGATLSLTENELEKEDNKIESFKNKNAVNLMNISESEEKDRKPLFPNWSEGNGYTKVQIENDMSAYLYIADGSTEVEIPTNIIMNHRNGRGRITLKSMDGSLLAENILTPKIKWQLNRFKVPQAGMYMLEIAHEGSTLNLKIPKIPFAFMSPTAGKRGKNWQSFYFYVPKDIDTLYVEFPSNSGIIYLISPNGNRIKYEIGNKDKIIKVPVGMNNDDIWEIKAHHPSFKLINIPHIVALSKKAVIK